MPLRTRSIALVSLSLLAASLLPAPGATASAAAHVILDGTPLPLNPAPLIENGRTLVPLRGVFEAMGASLTWIGETRTVEVVKGDRFVRLRIDRRLGCLDRDCLQAATLDVPARIIGDRTFVPVRFISQAIGAKVSWDAERRAVLIESDQPPVPQPAPVSLNLLPGQIIYQPVSLQATGGTGTHIKFHLINPTTGSGPLAAAGSDPTAVYTFVPDPVNVGFRQLVAAVTGHDGVIRYSDPVLVMVAANTTVAVTGIEPGGVVTGPVSFGSKLGFVATHVTFQLTDPSTGTTETLATAGPNESFTWFPQIGHNGPKLLQAVAYDRSGTAYSSEPVAVSVKSGYRQALSGIKNGDVLSRPATFSVRTNYPVESIQYLLNGKTLGWGASHTWRFGPEANGQHSLQVQVTAKDGTKQTLGPISFTVDTKPQVWPSGIGPSQVVTGATTLRATGNVPLKSIAFKLLDSGSGADLWLGSVAPGESLTWTPAPGQEGERTIQAVGVSETGELIASTPVKFRVYLGKVFGPRPVVAKSEFLDLAAKLSVPAYLETGMSAALKVAQSILETGWGQSSPVDKYTGQISHNVFGIKGKGPAGSVISNTWEEYNGVAYRVDDYFRAYNNIEESWKDHADLLLTRSWYAPYRAVMTSPVLGAWGLRKSGYATDSQYPVKLINIMKQYDLFKLDEIEF